VIIRQIALEDAAEFLELGRRLDEETRLMMLEPGERALTVEQQRERIEQVLASENRTVLLALSRGQVIGFLEALGGEYRRNRGTAHVVIGVLREFRGQGVGTKLFDSLEDWAHARGIHRLELTVMTHNPAVALYRRVGFEVEGTRRHSLLVDGTYVDEYYMSRLL